ncbi:XRE family transcriptional regulator [Leptolyngbyaceae cyanobacterium CCMR0082]|uniref:XRE family transcriptional regulator n=1 Tax=Adonisia turfae CCMR0082 TaxID=2304604 RepID=A0A6M0S2C6_9CYAN|nr:helix-turn-helix transcriptional regulator [Adonisia turfae]MDV3349615.1 helix-turn-helix transcriptional regulator [Leptothoe sp. LEGE 181152]NEZ62546.1 XRE family transcriptional regulator [Adonisia turfae CCMR0082]
MAAYEKICYLLAILSKSCNLFKAMATNNLKRVLANEELTQGKVAQASGVSTSSLSKYYNQRRTPSPTTMGKIVNGINRLVGASRYKITDIFPSFDEG